jgi:predicted SprT family Zn-dependent metalloprotease
LTQWPLARGQIELDNRDLTIRSRVESSAASYVAAGSHDDFLLPAGIQLRLNTELVKKPKDLLEYVVVHEMLHLIEPTHGERFVALLSRHYPSWQEARAELNELPLADQIWKCVA